MIMNDISKIQRNKTDYDAHATAMHYILEISFIFMYYREVLIEYQQIYGERRIIGIIR